MASVGSSKVMLVTGAASGIGKELAVALEGRGHHLLLLDVNSEVLATQVGERGWKPPRVLARGLDVRDPAAWKQMVDLAIKTWGRLDVVFNVAGIVKPCWLAEATTAHVDAHLDVNAKGVIHGTLAAAAAMIPQGSGHVVNIASLAGVAPIPGIALYSASKFAVRGFSLAAAQEFAPKGVAVTCVCPDAVNTPMVDLQLYHESAAMTFSGPRVLETKEVVEVLVGRVLERRPVEVTIPAGRGLLAKLASAFPRLGMRLSPGMMKRGRTKQVKAKDKFESSR